MTAIARLLPVNITLVFEVNVEVPFVADFERLTESNEQMQGLADSVRSLVQRGVMDALGTAQARLAKDFRAEVKAAGGVQ